MSFGPKRLIADHSKNFFNLSDSDVADMIDAFLEGGSPDYDYSALPEFMLVPNKDTGLEAVREEVAKIDADARTDVEPNGLEAVEGRQALKRLAERLRGEAR